jgi:hypothetical protein
MDILASFSWEHTIAWYDLSDEYCPSGSLLSSILDLSTPADDWGTIEWDCVAYPNASVTVEVRSSNASYNMGSWAEVAASGDDLSDYLEPDTRYLQYQISLETDDGTVTPQFDEIRISWEPLPVRDGPASTPERFLLWEPRPNPSTGSATIHFAVPHTGAIEMTLYDLCGRMIRTIARGMYEPGEYEVTVKGIHCGTYVYHMAADGFRDTGTLVVR